MAKQGLNKERVVQAAVSLIEEKGFSQFSMGKLAQHLHVKTASLYNHVESLRQLLECVGEEAGRQLVSMEEQAVSGKHGEAALFALAGAYRAFAREHSELYRLIMTFPQWDSPILDREAGEILSPILRILSDYGLSETQKIHWQRVLRAVMSGFAFHEQSGGFSRVSADQEESFDIAIGCVADGLRRAGGENL